MVSSPSEICLWELKQTNKQTSTPTNKQTKQKLNAKFYFGVSVVANVQEGVQWIWWEPSVCQISHIIEPL